jgi:5'-3' exonuclease
MIKEQVLAVDGDILAYRIAAVCETHFEGAGFSILHSTLKEIVAETQITKMRIYLSGKNNFRYEIGKTKPYKGNRATMVRPQYLPHIRDYLVEHMNAIIVDGYEADDAIATDMTVNGAIHCGIDKDMLQIAGMHYNYVKKEWQEITEEQATLNLYRQILMGDTSDNIPGLPRVGEKKAFDAIQSAETAELDAQEMYKAVVNAQLPGVDWRVYMTEQENLITMVKDVELDYSKIYELAIDSEGFQAQDSGVIKVDEATFEAYVSKPNAVQAVEILKVRL